jgi:hypothetical protein
VNAATATTRPDENLVVFNANMSEAMRRHYRRTKEAMFDPSAPMPFEQMLAAEDDGISGGDGGIGDYEMQQRVVGVRAFLRWIKTRAGVKPDQLYAPGPVSTILRQLFAAGRAMRDPFFSSISFTENGLMFSQTKAAASFRSQLISGFMEEIGFKGIRQPGQKSPLSSQNYAAVQKGNQNRKGGKPKARQSSFLKQLHTSKGQSRKSKVESGKPRQTTFTRKLTSQTAKPAPKEFGNQSGKSALSIGSQRGVTNASSTSRAPTVPMARSNSGAHTPISQPARSRASTGGIQRAIA